MIRILLFVVALIIAGCNSDNHDWVKNENAGAALGTSYNLIYLSKTDNDFQSEIDSVFKAINTSMSTYISDSDISRINKGDSTLIVDAMFQEVFKISKQVNRITNGYFDPTVGPLVDAWGFGPGEQILLDSTKVDSLLRFVGFGKVYITKKGTVSKSNTNISLDFNAVAKGYAIDRLAKLLDHKGIENYLLEVGGELVAKGENKIKDKNWVVGIDDPEIEMHRELKKLIYLKDRALASSGNYRKFRVDNETGKKYVHTVDPKTGFTKNGHTLAATVLAKSCAEADAYATAFMVMDLEQVLKLLSKERSLDGYIIYVDEHGETQEFMTEGFSSLVVE